MKAIVLGLATTALALGMTVGASAAGAAAAPAPAAVTAPASQIAAHSVVVNGTVNPNGTATNYTFQYGPTTSYGFGTTVAPAGSGTTAVALHATLTHLISNSTYHFRIVAVSAAGTTPGADATFTTAKAPPLVTLSSPSTVTSTGATVDGTVNPNGKATTYAFQYGPTTKYGLGSATTAAGAGTANVAVHADLTGLAPGTTYHYRMIAVSADGTTVSPDATLLTTGNRVAPTGPLPVVSEANAVAISAHGVQLNGAINPKGATTTWYFEFGLTTDYGLQSSTQTLSGLGARPINAHLDGLQADATYHYRLVAMSANGLFIGPDHTFTTEAMSRQSDVLMINASAHRRNGTVRVAVDGRLQLPASSPIPSDAACSGTVALQFQQGRTTVALRHAQLRPDCTYRLVAHIPSRRLSGGSQLHVVGYFWGNAALMPGTKRMSLRIR